MADATIQISGLGSSSAPLDYKLSGEQEFYLAAVRAIFDGTGAAGAFQPAVQLLSPAGTVMWQTEGTAVLAGGSADASFFPLRQSTTGAAQKGFADTVATIAVANTLRGYWRLGEAAAPFADTSGWSGGPTNLTVSGAGTAPTTHVPGALTGGQDDGAIQLNGAPATGQYLHNASGSVNTGVNSSVSIMAWVKPFASASNWIAAVYNNVALSGGHINGWALVIVWSGGNVFAYWRRIINDAVVSASLQIPTDTWTFLVSTYDGANLRLYSNGLLAATTADARADTFDPYSNVDLGTTFNDPFPPVGTIDGVIDEVAIWDAVLSLSQIQTLYAAAFA